MRVLTIFVRAGTVDYAGAESAVTELFARQLPRIEHDLLVVDNLAPRGILESRPGRTVIGGDNTVWEFSAVDEALGYVAQGIWRFDLVNVVTSAFQQLYTAYLERFSPQVLAAIVGRNVCLGHIDCYNDAVRIGRFRSQHWLRTSFLMMPPAELKALGSFVSARHRRPWLSGCVDDPFGPGSPLDDTYRRYLRSWLLGEDIGQGVTWHRKLTLDEAGLEQFEQKALAIINEHLLSIRLRAAGCRVIDVTWLSATLASGAAPDWTCRWWDQLAQRDRDAICVAALS